MKRVLSGIALLAAAVGLWFFISKLSVQSSLVWNKLVCPQIQNVVTDQESEAYGQPVLKAHSDFLKIRAVQREISQEEAVRQFQGMEASLLSFYIPRASPYIGMLTRVSDCPEKFRPQKLSAESNSPHQGFLMFSTPRFGAGVCSDDLAAYAMLQFIIYCPGRSYEVTTYDSEKNFERLKEIFNTCECR